MVQRRGLDTGRCLMKAIVVTDEAAGTAGMTLVERPEPEPAINDVVVQVHASGFTSGELTWPSTWTDRVGRDRTPSIPGQELAGVVTALGYGTTGLSVGQRVFGLTDSYRGGGLAEYAAIEARNLAPLPGDVDFTVGASLPMPGLTASQGLFNHGRLEAGQSVLVHGAAGSVGSMVTQLAREAGAYVIGSGRTSATSQPSTMPSRLSIRPSGSAGRRSSAFVRERHAPINAPKRQMTEETIPMKAIVVTDQAAGTAGMTLVERPEPPAAINDVVVEVHASGFVPTELAWPSTWTDRRDRDRTPSIPGHELAGVVTALGYGTTGLSVGQRVFGLTDWHRDGTLAEYVAVEARNDALEDVDEVDLVFDVIGGDIQQRSAGLVRAGGTLVSVVGPTEARPADGLAVDFVVESDRAQLGEVVQRVRDGRLRTNIGNVATLDDAVAALNPTERRKGKTIIHVRP